MVVFVGSVTWLPACKPRNETLPAVVPGRKDQVDGSHVAADVVLGEIAHGLEHEIVGGAKPEPAVEGVDHVQGSPVGVGGPGSGCGIRCCRFGTPPNVYGVFTHSATARRELKGFGDGGSAPEKTKVPLMATRRGWLDQRRAA